MWEVIETSTIRKERMRCSKCGFTRIFIDGHSGQYNYCPQCGAKQTEPQTEQVKEVCDRPYLESCDLCWKQFHCRAKDEPTISKMEQVEEPTEITYQNCSDALLKMWMDNVLTDAEYNRIMDKLNNALRKDEPQTCEECEHWNDTEDGCADRHGCKVEPQTDEEYINNLPWVEVGNGEQTDEPQTKYDTCRFEDYSASKEPCNSCLVDGSKWQPMDGPQLHMDGYYRKDEPQTETEIAKAIVHKIIDDAVIAEDAYPDLRQRMHDAVDEYEPQTDCAWK